MSAVDNSNNNNARVVDNSHPNRDSEESSRNSLTRSVSWSSNLPTSHNNSSRGRENSNPNNRRNNMAAVNEETPIVNGNSSASRRDYQSTDNQPRDTPDHVDQNGLRNGQLSRRRSRQDSALNRQETATDDINGGNDNDEGSRQPWHRRVVDKYGALELDNKGSVARDHLALERTFLAWLRTSLAFASIGIAVTQLFRLNSSITPPTGHSSIDSLNSNIINPSLPVDQGSSSSSSSLLEILLAPTTDGPNETRLRNVGKPLGATFIAIAILILLIGFHRYFEAQYWIVRGKFPASRGSVALVTFVAAGLIVSSLVVILAIAPTALER